MSKLLTAYPRTVQPLASSREQLGIPTLITRRCNSSSRFLGNQSRFIGNNSGSRYTTSSSRFSPPEDAQPSSTNSLLETSHYLNPPSDSLESISPTPDQEASSSEITFKAETPSYDLTFTCSPCDKRSTHRITKQGYHKGTVLITCPECKNKHLISDHLKVSLNKSREKSQRALLTNPYRSSPTPP